MVNKKLTRYIDDVEKTEKKIAELQQHLKNVRVKQRRTEEQEIVRSIRDLGLSDRGLVQILEAIQDGRISLNIEDIDKLPPVETEASDSDRNESLSDEADPAGDSAESAADGAGLADDSTESAAVGANSLPDDISENMEEQVHGTAPESEDAI